MRNPAHVLTKVSFPLLRKDNQEKDKLYFYYQPFYLFVMYCMLFYWLISLNHKWCEILLFFFEWNSLSSCLLKQLRSCNRELHKCVGRVSTLLWRRWILSSARRYMLSLWNVPCPWWWGCHGNTVCVEGTEFLRLQPCSSKNWMFLLWNSFYIWKYVVFLALILIFCRKTTFRQVMILFNRI